MIEFYEAASILREHAREIMRQARRSGKDGYKILAEVDGDGTWRGAGVVTPGTGSLLAYENRGYACYFSCSPFRSLADINEQIYEWEEQMQQRVDEMGS